MVKLPQRITDIATEVADHFVRHIRPNRFKAMLVCYNKETVASTRQHLMLCWDQRSASRYSPM